MKRFNWRLQRVLDLKEQTEKVKEAELLQLTEVITEQKAHYLNEVHRQRQSMRNIAKAAPDQRLSQQAFYLHFSEYDDQRLRSLKAEIDHLEAQLKQKTQELIEIKRAKEGMEKLREEAMTRFQKEQNQLEQKESDDRTTTTFARQQPDKQLH